MIDPAMMGGPAGPGPGGPPPGAAGPSPTSPTKGDHTDRLRDAIESLTAFKIEEQDDEDLALADEIIAKCQKLLANNQKLADQAVGAGPGAKFMRKQGGGGSY